MNQIELNLDARVVERHHFPEKEDPESTLVQDTLSPVLRRVLSDEEFARIERSIKRLDWNMDLIERDRKIKEFIRKKTDNGFKVHLAVEEAAKKFFLGEETVYGILYDKRRANNDD